MKIIEIVTIKPQSRVIEYQVTDAGETLSHGHVATIPPETDLAASTYADLQALAEADALAKSLVETPGE